MFIHKSFFENLCFHNSIYILYENFFIDHIHNEYDIAYIPYSYILIQYNTIIHQYIYFSNSFNSSPFKMKFIFQECKIHFLKYSLSNIPNIPQINCNLCMEFNKLSLRNYY